MDIHELEKQYKIIDMMLSGHSRLRDENHRLALVVNLLLLCASVILSTLVFVDTNILVFLRIEPQVSRIVIGVCSTLVFLMSLIEFRVDWKEKAARHNQACEILSRLKAESRELLKSANQPESEHIVNQYKICAQTLSTLPKIPEKKFHSLKAYHQSKKELSKLIDMSPGAPVWLLRIVLLFSSIKKLFLG